MKTPFLGGAYQSRSLNLACQRAINIYPEIVETKQGKEVGAFYGTPGLVLQVTVGNGPIRGFGAGMGSLFVASGTQVYMVSSSYATKLLGTIQGSGPVQFIANTSQVMLTDGVDGYVWNGSTFKPGVLSPLGITPTNLGYQDGFGIVNDASSNRWFQSNLNDLTTWSSINFSSADSRPDNVVALVDNRREVWLFGTDSTEVWINAGLSGFAFQRLQGVALNQGCIAPASACVAGNSIYWLGQDDQGAGIVWKQDGYTAVPISTHAISRAIQGYSTMADAIGYSYQQEQHVFYVLTFPTGNETWVYDATTSALMKQPMWHQRASFSNGAFGRHWGNCAVFFGGKTLVGDYQNGNVYAYDLNTYQDNGTPVKRLRSWRAVQGSVDKPLRFNQLAIDLQSGISVPDGANPQMALRWSDDGGHNFSSEWLASLGQPGQTAQRVMWNRLGQTRKNSGLDRVWEISHSENMPTAWIAANMDAEAA